MTDARFEDGGEEPLRILAVDAEGLQVVSSLIQDSVFPVAEMTWRTRQREFAILLNRFRWEDKDRADARGRDYERVQTVLLVRDVTKVASQGIDRSDSEVVLSLLSLEWQDGDDGAGRLVLTLAGDGAIAVDAGCLDVSLSDVTRPYGAVSGKAPSHKD